MRDLAIVLALCATSCATRPALVDTDVPLASCGGGIACPQGGGTGTLLVPIAALVAVAVFFTVAVFTDEPEHPARTALP